MASSIARLNVVHRSHERQLQATNGPSGRRSSDPSQKCWRGQLIPTCSLQNRDSKFSAAFDEVLKSEGVDVIHLPFRRPVANAFAERWVGSARRECLDHLLIFGRRHLEKVLAEFIDHYNQARPHQGLDQRVASPPADTIVTLGGRVERRDRLGGLLHEYARAA